MDRQAGDAVRRDRPDRRLWPARSTWRCSTSSVRPATRRSTGCWADRPATRSGPSPDSRRRRLSARWRIAVPTPAARNQGKAYQNQVQALVKQLPDGPRLRAGRAGLADAGRRGVGRRRHREQPSAVVRRAVLRLQSRSGAQDLRRDGDAPGLRARHRRPRASFRRCCAKDWSTWCGRTSRVHGISGARRIAVLAETYYVAIAPHHDGGPVATAAALHLAASVPNFFIQHVPRPAGPGGPRDACRDRVRRPGDAARRIPATSARPRPRHRRERSRRWRNTMRRRSFLAFGAPAWRWPSDRAKRRRA